MIPILRAASLVCLLGWGLACADSSPDPASADSRSFQMGLTYWPPAGDQTSTSVVRRELPLLLRNTNVVHVQIPWCPGREPVQAEWLGLLAREAGQHFALSVDWLADGRNRLRCSDNEPWSFSDSAAAQDFQETMAWLAHRYRPEYLILGVEVDYYAVAAPDDFRSFLTTYRRARDHIESTLPTTRVGVSIQYEHALRVSGPDGTLFEGMVEAFRGMSDFLGLSVYPFTVGLAPADVGRGYFEAAAGIGWPVTITETAWPGRNTPQQQRAFLTNVLTASEAIGASLVVWTSLVDVEAGALGSEIEPWAKALGLWDRAGNPRPALTVWHTWLKKPISEGRNRPER